MTNEQGLYFAIAVIFIVAILVVYLIVKRNADGPFDENISKTAVKHRYLPTLIYPLFVIAALIIIGLVVLFQS